MQKTYFILFLKHLLTRNVKNNVKKNFLCAFCYKFNRILFNSNYAMHIIYSHMFLMYLSSRLNHFVFWIKISFFD